MKRWMRSASASLSVAGGAGLSSLMAAVLPAELLERPARIPDLGHVADFSIRELHVVDVVRLGALARGRRPARTGVRALEHRIGRHGAARLVDRERSELIAAVGHHP